MTMLSYRQDTIVAAYPWFLFRRGDCRKAESRKSWRSCSPLLLIVRRTFKRSENYSPSFFLFLSISIFDQRNRLSYLLALQFILLDYLYSRFQIIVLVMQNWSLRLFRIDWLVRRSTPSTPFYVSSVNLFLSGISSLIVKRKLFLLLVLLILQARNERGCKCGLWSLRLLTLSYLSIYHIFNLLFGRQHVGTTLWEC